MSSENESVSPPLNVEKCSLVLVDIAGTTTSINFVKDTLFPFVVERAETFLTANWDKDSVKECLKQIQKDGELDIAKAVETVKKLTEENSSNQGFKTLQGLIYEEGYQKGDLKAHVFEDVAEALENWAKTRKIAVYSTGSVDSQKLLFTHTISGDLSGYIFKYFDQTIGEKTEAESYKKIAEETQVPVEEIVFITDDVDEAKSAKAGGLHAVLIKRSGNAELPEDVSKDFVIVSSFSELALDKSSKRKIEEGPVEAPPSKVPKTDSETKDGNAAEKVEQQESMEVDPQPEKPAEKEKSETATEETENLVKNAPQKTENEDDKKETTDTEMKETEKEKIESETPAEPIVEKVAEETTAEETKTTVAELAPIVEEPVVEAENSTKKEATETKQQEEKVNEEPKKVAEKDEAKEESKPVEQITVEEVKGEVPEAVVANIEPIVEEPETKESEKKSDEQPSTEIVVKEIEVQPAAEEKPKEAVAEETKSESKPEETKTDVEMTETKPEQSKSEEKSTAEEETVKNGEEEKAETVKNGEEEKAETSAPKTEEKENKSVLANGVENGNKDESEVDHHTAEEKESETAEVKNDDNVDNKDDDNEVKVKKLEESAESKTVSVEV